MTKYEPITGQIGLEKLLNHIQALLLGEHKHHQAGLTTTIEDAYARGYQAALTDLAQAVGLIPREEEPE